MRAVVATRLVSSSSPSSSSSCVTSTARGCSTSPSPSSSTSSLVRLRYHHRNRNRREGLCVARRATPKENGAENDDDKDDKDDDKDWTDAVSLTSNQARIAALAFDVLYNKPFLNEEKLLKEDPPERPKLRLMLREAIDRANQLCKEQEDDKNDGSPVSQESMKECRAAWEMVDELEDAAMRAGMTRTNKTVESARGGDWEEEKNNAPGNKRGTQPPRRRIPKMNEVGLSEEELKERAKVKRVDPFEDPLKDLDPCGPMGCEAETGEMNSRGILERAMKIPNKEERKKFDEESDKTLANAISEAVEKAMSLCDEGGDACATAWEVVEELSASANKRRMEKRKEIEE